MRKHTRATPAGVPRGRSKFTRAQRQYVWLCGLDVKVPVVAAKMALRRMNWPKEFPFRRIEAGPCAYLSIEFDGTATVTDFPDKYRPTYLPTVTGTWVGNDTPPA